MKILIINFMQIGDLVLTTPLFEAIKRAYPDSFLAVAVNKQFSLLIEHNPFLDKIFPVDKSSWRSFFKNLAAVRNEHFDFAFNLNRSERASAFAALSNANFISGYSKPLFALLFNRVEPNLNRHMHQVFSHFKVFDNSGFNLNLCPSSIFVPLDVADKINLFWLAHFKSSDRVVAFNVGASWPSKRWLPQYFASVADELIKRGFHVVFLGARADIPIVDHCLSFMDLKHKALIFTGFFNLLELAALFDHCKLLISNDSGPMHIAVARNLPTLSVFGSSPVTGFFPFNSNSILIKSPVVCHPCYKHLCPKHSLDCMTVVKPVVVLYLALLILTSNQSPLTFSPLPMIY